MSVTGKNLILKEVFENLETVLERFNIQGDRVQSLLRLYSTNNIYLLTINLPE